MTGSSYGAELSFEVLWGMMGSWTLSQNEQNHIESSLWASHNAQTYFAEQSGLSVSDIMNNDGVIIIPFTGQYDLTLSIKLDVLNYLGGLSGYLLYQSVDGKNNTYNNAMLCMTSGNGQDDCMKTTSRCILLNKGDRLVPTYVPTDVFTNLSSQAYIANKTPCFCNTIGIVYHGRSRPISVFGNQLNRISVPGVLTLTNTMDGQTNLTVFYLTSDKTATGAPILAKLTATPLLSVNQVASSTLNVLNLPVIYIANVLSINANSTQVTVIVSDLNGKAPPKGTIISCYFFGQRI